MTTETKKTGENGTVSFDDNSGRFDVTAGGYSPATVGGDGLGHMVYIELTPERAPEHTEVQR